MMKLLVLLASRFSKKFTAAKQKGYINLTRNTFKWNAELMRKYEKSIKVKKISEKW